MKPPERKKALEPKDWMKQISLGQKFKEQVGYSKAWNKWKSYYVGNYAADGGGVIPVNMIFSNGKILVPKSYFRNPQVKVTPTRPEYFYQSFVVNSVVNQLIRELRIKYQIKAMVEDCYATGTAFGKLGFDSQYGYFPENTKLSDTQTTADKGGPRAIEYNVNVKQGMPWFLWCDAEDVVVPWGSAKSGDPEITDIPWIAHRVRRLVDDVKADPKYTNTKDLSANYKPDIADYRTEENAEYIELWEIRDYSKRRIYTITDDYNEYLLNDDDALQIEGFPYTRMIFNPHPKYFWGISDIKNLEPHQMALNVAYTIFVHHIRMALKKFGYQTGSIKENQIDALLSDKFAAAIAFDGNPNEVFKEFNFTIPQDIIIAINEIRKTIRELVGYSRNEAGEFDQSTRRTATEANLVKVGSETRSSERRDIVADVLESVVRKLCQIVFTFWTKPQVVPIIGEDGVQYWVEFTADDIRGEYQFNINAEDAQPVDSQRVSEDAINVLRQLMDDQDFNPEERRKVKIMLLSQFSHLGIDIEQAFAPREGMGGNEQQPIPFQQWAGGMQKGKQQKRATMAQAPPIPPAMAAGLQGMMKK